MCACTQVLLSIHSDGSLVASAVAAAARTLSTLWSVAAGGGPREPLAQVRACAHSLFLMVCWLWLNVMRLIACFRLLILGSCEGRIPSPFLTERVCHVRRGAGNAGVPAVVIGVGLGLVDHCGWSQAALVAEAHHVLPAGALLLVGTAGGAVAAFEATGRAEPRLVGSAAAGAPVHGLGYSAAGGQACLKHQCDPLMAHSHARLPCSLCHMRGPPCPAAACADLLCLALSTCHRPLRNGISHVGSPGGAHSAASLCHKLS
jgi:hypothetical protein